MIPFQFVPPLFESSISYLCVHSICWIRECVINRCSSAMHCIPTSWSSATVAVDLRRLRCAVIGGNSCLCLPYLYRPATISDELLPREKSYAISIKHKLSYVCALTRTSFSASVEFNIMKTMHFLFLEGKFLCHPKSRLR